MKLKKLDYNINAIKLCEYLVLLHACRNKTLPLDPSGFVGLNNIKYCRKVGEKLNTREWTHKCRKVGLIR